jgi:outer membrane protein assembly factor BamB
MKLSRNTSVIVLFVVLISSVALAADWGQWRGPNRDGCSTETGLLAAWPKDGPALAWKATGIGAGFSTVAIAGERIYTTGEKGDSDFVHCLDLNGGKILWSAKYGKSGAPGWGGFTGPRGTPTVDGEMLYVIGQYGEVACLKTADGSVVWSKALDKDFGGKRPEWGFSESALIDGNQMICTPGGAQGAIVALDKKTGNLLWQTKDFTDEAHYSSIVTAEIGGVKQYIQLTAASVVGVGIDGKLLWKAERKGKTAVIPTPVVSGNKVFVTSGYGVGCNMFEVTKAGDAFSAKQVYAEKSMADQHGGAIRVGDYVYGHCDSKGWVCQELATGQTKWAEKGQIGKGSVVFADGKLFLRAEDGGTVGMIAASPEGYKELGRFVQPGFGKPKTWPHPVVFGKKLYLRDQDQLLCYDVAAK